jgi:hypothetical protein
MITVSATRETISPEALEGTTEWVDPRNPWGSIGWDDRQTIEFATVEEAAEFVRRFPGGVWDYRESEASQDPRTGEWQSVTLFGTGWRWSRVLDAVTVAECIRDGRCPGCGGVMDDQALAFWAGEDPIDYDAEDATCTPCHYFKHFGTRNPTVRQFHDAGWDHEWSQVFGIRLPGPNDEPVVACADCARTFFTVRDGFILDQETEAEVLGAEWITDPASIKFGEFCACCRLVQDTGWNGSEWVTE